MTGVQLSDLCTDHIGDALEGWWIKNWGTDVRLTVLKSHALLNSHIMDSDKAVSLTLPNHEAFYASIQSANGTRNVLVGKNENLSLTLNAGEMLSAIFTLTR